MKVMDKEELAYRNYISNKIIVLILFFFYLMAFLLLLSQGILKYIITIFVWGDRDFKHFLLDFFVRYPPIGLFLAVVHSLFIYSIIHKIKNRIISTKTNSESKDDTLADDLYRKQKTLSIVFLSFGFFYSLTTIMDWFYNPIEFNFLLLLLQISTLMVYFSLTFLGYRVFHLFMARFMCNIRNLYELRPLEHRSSVYYELFIAAIGMGLFLILFATTINISKKFQREILSQNSTNNNNVLLYNFTNGNALQQISGNKITEIDGTLSSQDIFEIFRVSLVRSMGGYLLLLYFFWIFILYWLGIFLLLKTPPLQLSKCLENFALQNMSLRDFPLLLSIENRNHISRYLYLLLHNIYQNMAGLRLHLAEISNNSKTLIVDTDTTDKIYKVIFNSFSTHMQANTQLHLVKSITGVLNNLREVTVSKNKEIYLEKEQWELTKNTITDLNLAIIGVVQSEESAVNVFQELDNYVNNGLEMIGNAHNIMIEISKDSHEIYNIFSNMKRISGQVGLLAMNAFSESAHAGNHGLGFSVVAGSVNNLSSESATQSKIMSYQIDEIVSKVDSGIRLIDLIRHSFDSMMGNVKISSGLLNQLNDYLNEQKVQSQNTCMAIENSLATTKEISDFIETQIASIDKLLQTSTTMEQNIQQFYGSRSSLLHCSDEILSLFEQLNHQIEQDKECIHSMYEEIRRHKLDSGE